MEKVGGLYIVYVFSVYQTIYYLLIVVVLTFQYVLELVFSARVSTDFVCRNSTDF